MMSKLSFRAKPLDASKPMPIYMAEELPNLPDYSAINRAVPQMPSGMTKEEECEHHLQRAICAGLIIPTPEVTDLTDVEAYDKIYPADYKLPRQLIHMQPFAMEQDIPDYDMDSEDEKWVGMQSRKMDLTPLQFEEMMDRLEKSSGQTVVTLNEAKALLKEDDDLIIAVFDYWLNKRLKTQHPLLLTVKTDHRPGSAANNPYLAFRRITEKMQTRKNRKNDESSYEKMLKLRRELSKAVTLLELVKRREKTKREHLHLTIEVFEKRYQAEDFNGQILAEVSALKTVRPAFAPLFTNQFGVHQNWSNKVCKKEDGLPRKEKRQYKKRKHKLDGRPSSGLDEGVLMRTSSSSHRHLRTGVLGSSGLDPLASSDEDNPFPHTQLSTSSMLTNDHDDDDDVADESPFTFRRNRYCNYLPPVSGGLGNWPWYSKDEGGTADKKYRFALTSISKPTPRCIGYARRRIGRGGRVILDRYPTDIDDIWSSLDFTIHEPQDLQQTDPINNNATNLKQEWLHFHPKTTSPVAGLDPNPSDEESSWSTSNSSRASRNSSNSNSCSEDSEGEIDGYGIRTSSSSTLYPFPPEATSLCVDIEPERFNNCDETPFTTEFNIADYFSVDELTDFELGVQNTSEETLGSSRFQVTPVNNTFNYRNNQCSVSKSVNNSSGTIKKIQNSPSTSVNVTNSLSSTSSSQPYSLPSLSSSSSLSSLSSASSLSSLSSFTTATTITSTTSTAFTTTATSMMSSTAITTMNSTTSLSLTSLSTTVVTTATMTTATVASTTSSTSTTVMTTTSMINPTTSSLSSLSTLAVSTNSPTSTTHSNTSTLPLMTGGSMPTSLLSLSSGSSTSSMDHRAPSSITIISSSLPTSTSHPSNSIITTQPITQCTGSSGISNQMRQLNQQNNLHNYHLNQQNYNYQRSLVNSNQLSSSILSKSLTSPTRNTRIGSLLGFGNGHQQNGPTSNIHNNSVVSGAIVSNNIGGTHNINANIQSAVVTPQIHSSPSSLLPGFIAQTKLANLARQQQQQDQSQQSQLEIPTSGEITLNSNSEGMGMEVDGVEGSSCENKQQQQQQIVRTNKNNSLAMEVT
ncbi:enhancer of polycomb homolog 1 [Chelonus insularis]|uniref:enhancer of polycomb homolog 1 n=1 Tax=Chelonus insularis TaxID=460826 RepID=UPI00158A5DD6|nr:enhancer of polycomb homolog 1 [Chelonus insularis]